MARWVKLCGLPQTPAIGGVMEVEIEGVAVCLANVNGRLSALDNVCPHRQGPLGQGWVEGEAVVCPWHSWTFDVKTGVAGYPDKGQVAVLPLRIQGDDVFVEINEGEPGSELFRDE